MAAGYLDTCGFVVVVVDVWFFFFSVVLCQDDLAKAEKNQNILQGSINQDHEQGITPFATG